MKLTNERTLVSRLFLAITLCLLPLSKGEITLGSDASIVDFYTIQSGSQFGITVTTPFYNNPVYPYRLVLDFEPWGGNYASFGTCENVSPDSTYRSELSVDFESRWKSPASCATVGNNQNEHGTYPLVFQNAFWKTMQCDSGTDDVVWDGYIPITQFVSGCRGRNNEALVSGIDTLNSILYSTTLYKTQLVPKNFGSLKFNSGSMYYSADPRSAGGSTLNTSSWVAMGRGQVGTASEVTMNQILTSSDLFLNVIFNLTTPYNLASTYSIAMKANYVATNGTYNVYSGKVFVYANNLVATGVVVNENTFGVLDYGNIVLYVSDTTVTSSDPVKFSLSFTYGSMQPNGFPVSFDLSQGNPYRSLEESAFAAGTAVSSYSSRNYKLSFISENPGYNTYAQAVPLQIQVDKFSNLITSISTNQLVQYTNQLWYVSRDPISSLYTYTLNFTAKIFVISPTYNAAMISVLTPLATSEGYGYVQFIPEHTTLQCGFYDIPSQQNYCIQTFTAKTSPISVAPPYMLGNYFFEGTLGQCLTLPNSAGITASLSSVACNGNQGVISPLFNVAGFINIPNTLNLEVPISNYLQETSNLATISASDYEAALTLGTYQVAYQQGQRILGVTTLQQNVITSLNQFELQIKDLYICSPNVQSLPITHDGISTFGCDVSSYASNSNPIFQSYKLISNYAPNPSFSGSNSFRPEISQAPNMVIDQDDHRACGYNFYVEPISTETRTWYLHIVANVSVIGGLKRSADVVTIGEENHVLNAFLIQPTSGGNSSSSSGSNSIVLDDVNNDVAKAFAKATSTSPMMITILVLICFVLLITMVMLAWNMYGCYKNGKRRSYGKVGKRNKV